MNSSSLYLYKWAFLFFFPLFLLLVLEEATVVHVEN